MIAYRLLKIAQFGECQSAIVPGSGNIRIARESLAERLSGMRETLRLRQRNSAVIALVPYPEGRWPEALRPSITMILWDRATTVAQVLNALRCQQQELLDLRVIGLPKLAVVLRVLFTLVVAEAMTYPFLKLVGGALLFWVAIKLVTEDADEDSEMQAGETLWRAVRIVVIADSSRVGPPRTIGLLDGQDTLTVSDMPAKLAAQIAGLGCGSLPRFLAAPAAASGQLVIKRLAEPRPAMPVHIAWRAERPGRALAWWLKALDDGRWAALLAR